MKAKNPITIRNPNLDEMGDVANILVKSFNDKISFIFPENLNLGEEIFKELMTKYMRKKDLLRFFVAVHEKEILGTLEINTKTKIPSLFEELLIFFIITKNFGFLRSIKKFVSLMLMIMEFVKKRELHITFVAVKPEARSQNIGRQLIYAAERLAVKLNCKYLALDVVYRNHRAQKLYKKLGFKEILRMESSFFLYFMGINGAIRMRKDLD